MDLEKLATLVDDMVLQLSYPDFDGRSLKLGLPDEVTKAPAKLFGQGLTHENVLVRLACLRWFQERPGVGKAHTRNMINALTDQDEWVRREAVLCLEKLDSPPEEALNVMTECLKDQCPEVRKAAAKALGKHGKKSEKVIAALRVAAEDPDTEVRWKAAKALRKLQAYAISKK